MAYSMAAMLSRIQATVMPAWLPYMSSTPDSFNSVSISTRDQPCVNPRRPDQADVSRIGSGHGELPSPTASTMRRTALPHIVTLGHMPPQQRWCIPFNRHADQQSTYCARRGYRRDTSRRTVSTSGSGAPAQADA